MRVRIRGVERECVSVVSYGKDGVLVQYNPWASEVFHGPNKNDVVVVAPKEEGKENEQTK